MEEMEDPEMEGKECWEKIPEDKKKALMKAKLEFKMKRVQAKLEFLKEVQKIFSYASIFWTNLICPFH